jgi:Zn-dependent protease/predicted transcriptional regulator
VSGGLPAGRIFGVVVRLSPAWIVMAVVVTFVGAQQAAVASPGLHVAVQWVLGALVAAGFLASVVAHELAHALVGRRVGVQVDHVVVGFAGGIGAAVAQAPRPRDDLAIALAGPVLSLALAAGCVPLALLAGTTGGSLTALAGGLIIICGLNLVLGLLSLLPAVPLDGARAVRALALARTGDRQRAARITARVGRFVGWTMLAAGVAVAALDRLAEGLMVLALGWVLARSSQAYDRRLGLEDLLRDATAADAIAEDGPVIGPSLTIDTFASRYEGEGGVPAIAVVEEGRVIGVVGIRSLQRLGRKRFATTRAADVMAGPPEAPILAPGDSLWEAAEIMDRRGLDGLAVADEDGLRGLVTSAGIGSLVRRRLEAGRTSVDS